MKNDFADALAHGLQAYYDKLDPSKAKGPELDTLVDLTMSDVRFETGDRVTFKFFDRDPAIDGKPIEWCTAAALTGKGARAEQASKAYREAELAERRAEDEALELWDKVCAGFKVKGPIAITFAIERPRAYGGRIRYIRGSVLTEDVNRPGHEISLSFERMLPRHMRTRDQMIRYLRTLVEWFFIHEARERMEVDGVRMFVPHEEHG